MNTQLLANQRPQFCLRLKNISSNLTMCAQLTLFHSYFDYYVINK